MTTRAKRGEGGELTVPRELFEGETPAEGTVMEVHRNERGDVVLRPVATWPVREYTDADLEMFVEEDELTPELEARLNSLLEREPRLFRR
ncbi:MAG: hypothetical protein ACRDTR_01020 [Rubrobacter sp.]